MSKSLVTIPPVKVVEKTILLVRGQKVILDRDLAQLYGVTTKALNQAVKRNLDRFPEDFMFQLDLVEAKNLRLIASKRSRSQIVTLNKGRGANVKYRPYAFTEHGILMLSSVLKSKRAVQVNIQIMRTFVRLREMLITNKELSQRFEELERRYDGQFTIVFKALKQLLPAPGRKRKTIGFRSSSLKK